MAYIGKPPSSVFSAAAKYDSFTGDGSTVAFDLANIVPAGGENGLQVYVDNVRQEPGASNAYTLGNDGSGDLKRITFTAAPDNGAEIYVITPYEATNIKNVGDGTITTAKIADSQVTSAKIADGTIVNADINACAAIDTTKLNSPGSSSVFLSGDGTYSAIDTTQQDTNAFNIGLLGFKMAVNEGLTVFNLIDGVVDEFNDESGTDESEGTNDFYCGTTDFYTNNSSPVNLSAGFTTTSITEPDTSVANTNPTFGSGTTGTFTVPNGMTSANFYLWGAGGGSHNYNPGSIANGGGGGFATGTLAVTSGQVLVVDVGEGGATSDDIGSVPAPAFSGAKGGKGGGAIEGSSGPMTSASWGAGGGATALYVACTVMPSVTAPQVYSVAGAGGGSGYSNTIGGAGGGLIGDAGGQTTEQINTAGNCSAGGGGDQEEGGSGASGADDGQFLEGGASSPDANAGSGGAGYWGGGGGSSNDDFRTGGGGSSYYGHPQISCGSTEEGTACEGGGITSPLYVAGTNEGGVSPSSGDDGYILITGSYNEVAAPGGGSTTIVSTAFSSTSVPTNARIVVFEENVDTPTLNTDIVASISRDAGVTYTNATLSDSGYVTGSSGQRILTGQADISGQPSGQSMRWKLALANNTVKIHGVSLQWS